MARRPSWAVSSSPSPRLFLLGLGVSFLTKRPPIRCGLRQLALGGIAALVTFFIGQAIGAAL